MATDISKLTVNNTEYTIKDASARTSLNKKVDVNQGVSNAGKFLVVNSAGNVEATSMSAWAGGSY